MDPIQKLSPRVQARRAARFARALLLLANFGKDGAPEPIIGHVSQETPAEMIGATRFRVVWKADIGGSGMTPYAELQRFASYGDYAAISPE